MRFRPAVLKVDENHEFRWKGKFVVTGLFDGEHYFILSGSDNEVTFTHGELFSGLLVPLLRGFLNGSTRQGFVAMNEALRLEAERA
jgi:hypothetical protein